MKFEKGKVYSHKNMLDLNIYVLYVFHTNNDSVKLIVQWYNRRGMYLGVQETIKINDSELPRWYEWNAQTEDWYHKS